MTRRLVWLVFFACVGLLALPSVAHAQSGIAGVVKDPSGAVLPGVTVEASSDVLIEKTRTVVTDGAGLFNIINLRPGTYVVTFTLSGFQTYKREGLELPGGFTANVDAIMKVGSLEESVTVSGASPVVDVSSNTKSAVLTREVLDSVPNAHTIQSVGQLIPGVSLTSPDVGGSVQMQQTYFAVHGFGASGTSVMMDGMVINTLLNDGAIQSYFTTAGSQEMVYQTGGGGGEAPTGGLNINMVPREGGNRFTGTSSLGLENWQSDNFGQELKDLGVTSVDKLGAYHDFDVAQGGPVKKDRIWFFAVGRLSHENKPVANTTNVTAVPGWSTATLTNATQSAALLTACRNAQASAGGPTAACPQGYSGETINSGLGRLTIQAASKVKLQLYMDRVHKDRAAAQGANDDQGVTSIHWTSPNYTTDAAKITATLTNRLLVEGGWSSAIERYDTYYQDGLEQPYYTPLWYQLVARSNTTDSRYTVAPVGEGRTYPDRYNWQGSTSYVTGAHNVKVGFLYSKGTFILGNYRNGDMVQQYQTNSAGLTNQPYQATLYPTDPRYSNNLKFLGDVYAQDSWTRKRLTVTGGIRYDFVQESAGGYPAQQGTFEIIPAFATLDMPKQTNWSPRISGVLDVFGTGKTALRAGFNHVAASATDNLVNSQNPGIGNTAAVPWTDVNGDNIAEYQVQALPGGGVNGCNYGTAGVLGCELNFAKLPGGFGAIAINNTLDPNLKRPYFNQTNIGVSQELMRGVSLSVEWYRTDGKNIQQTQNNARVVSGLTNYANNPNYTPFTVYSPLDGHAITMYDVTAAALATTAKNYTFTNPNLTSTYNGFDVGINARLPRGGRVFGGTTTERTLVNNCDTAISDPNLLLYCDTSNLGGGYSIPWKTQLKLSGTYPLPWFGIIANAGYQGLPGYLIARTTYSINKSSKYVTCPGTSAAAGCTVGAVIDAAMVNTSTSVPLDPTGVTNTPRTNQLDFGLAKRMKFGRIRFDPRIDLFNSLNSDAYYSVTSTALSPIVGPAGVNGPAIGSPAAGTQYTAYHQPARFLQGRIVKLGFNMSW
jgi:hypothetical protein